MTADTARYEMVPDLRGPWLRDHGPSRKRVRPEANPPRAERVGPRIDWAAFAVALAATPPVLALGGIFLIVPPLAVVLGLPAYLVCGTPAAAVAAWLWHRAGGRGSVLGFVLAGLVANLFGPIGYVTFAALAPLFTGEAEFFTPGLEELMFLMVPGFVFAPVMGLIFGLIYRGTVRWRARRRARAAGSARGRA